MLLCVLGLAAPASADPVGFFASVRGDVQLAAPAASGAFSWTAAARDGEVRIGDRVKTGLDSAARIVLVDDTMLHVAEDTEIEIETFHVGAAATKERSIVRHSRGRLRTLVGDAFGGETRLEVHTPTAVVGVKGTDFETSDASLPGRTRFRFCLHGGGITVGNGAGSVSPSPGHCVFAEKGKPPSAPFPNPDAPFEAPDLPGFAGPPGAPDDDPADPLDFFEPLDPTSPSLPAGGDPQFDDALQVFELPDGGSVNPPPITGPALVAGP
jgi:hypothetical protein